MSYFTFSIYKTLYHFPPTNSVLVRKHCSHPTNHTANMPGQSTILLLPAELRYHIYSYLYLSESPIDITSQSPHRFEIPLFYACRQLHHEVLHYYYSRNTFSVSIDRHMRMLNCRGRSPREPLMLKRHFNMIQLLQLDFTHPKGWLDWDFYFSLKYTIPTKQCLHRSICG